MNQNKSIALSEKIVITVTLGNFKKKEIIRQWRRKIRARTTKILKKKKKKNWKGNNSLDGVIDALCDRHVQLLAEDLFRRVGRQVETIETRVGSKKFRLLYKATLIWSWRSVRLKETHNWLYENE